MDLQVCGVANEAPQGRRPPEQGVLPRGSYSNDEDDITSAVFML